MKPSMRLIRSIATAVAGVTALTLAHAGALAAWPEKPVKIIVPFKAGGTSDQVSRAFQMAIQDNELLPQPATIVNVGGHFSIGSRQVMEAEPDGYTFLTVHIALMGGQAGGMFDFGYRDFAPVAATGQFCVLPMVRKDSGIDSVDQLLEKAAAEPDTLIFGANLGAINHLAGVMLQNTEPGAKFRFVQIGGGTANFTALTGAQTNATVLSAAEVLNFTRMPDGSENPESQIKPLAYTGPERVGKLPEIPTLKELGRDMEFCIDSWWFAPKDTPQEAIDGMADALEKASATDAIKAFYDGKVFAPLFLRGEALQESLDATWAAIEPVAIQASQK
ncbi:MAG: tripartite tricarboxylate transporter substrate binding protein [Geminicoccaceae bacterium]|nr:tripartite tricarboxylate transporter substrate binding protein [Geminicoccaceae bacterium]